MTATSGTSFTSASLVHFRPEQAISVGYSAGEQDDYGSEAVCQSNPKRARYLRRLTDRDRNLAVRRRPTRAGTARCRKSYGRSIAHDRGSLSAAWTWRRVDSRLDLGTRPDLCRHGRDRRPAREEAGLATAEAHYAGTRVMMITGDHPGTAARIASQLGIVSADTKALTGAELEATTAG